MPTAWYMPMIIGIYLFLPYVGIALSKINLRVLQGILIILYGYIFVVPSLNQVLVILNKPEISNQLDLPYGGGYCAFYILIGYCLSWFKDSSLASKLWFRILGLLVATLLFICTIIFEIWTCKLGKPYSVWYDFMTLPIIAAFIFLSFNQLSLSLKPWQKKTIIKVSDCSFGIYLVHYPLLVLLTNNLIAYRSNFFFLLFLSLIVYLITLGIVLVIDQNKRIGTLLFFR